MPGKHISSQPHLWLLTLTTLHPLPGWLGRLPLSEDTPPSTGIALLTWGAWFTIILIALLLPVGLIIWGLLTANDKRPRPKRKTARLPWYIIVIPLAALTCSIITLSITRRTATQPAAISQVDTPQPTTTRPANLSTQTPAEATTTSIPPPTASPTATATTEPESTPASTDTTVPPTPSPDAASGGAVGDGGDVWIAEDAGPVSPAAEITYNLPPADAPSISLDSLPQVQAMQIIIPALGLDVQLVEAPIVGETWDVSNLYNEVAHLQYTAFPGTIGNAVLAGHVTHTLGAGPFRYLNSMQPGDIIIAEGDGVTYTYQVSWLSQVPPTAVEVTYPSDQPIITLITCANWDSINRRYTDRVVVRASLIDVTSH